MTLASVVIRRAAAGDRDRLLQLIVDHAQFEGAMATLTMKGLDAVLLSLEPPTIIYVAAKSHDLLGYAALTFDFSLWRGQVWAHLDCLFVRSDSRSIAVGAKLFEAVVARSKAEGADQLEWQTPQWNTRAAAFYTRLGGRAQLKQRFSLPLSSNVFAIADAAGSDCGSND